MEGSSAPPEVIKQAVGSDQSGADQQDPQQNHSHSNQLQQLMSQHQPGNQSPAGQELGELTGANPGETISLWDQLAMISPWGLLKTITTQATGREPSPEQLQHQKEQEQHQASLIAANQQAHQEYTAQKQQQQALLQQRIEALKQQAAGLKHVAAGSAIKAPSTKTASQSNLQLTEKSLQDAQREAARRQQSKSRDPGSATPKGPRSFTATTQTQGGYQKLNEQTMGE